MCYWILPVSGIPLARTTIQAISNEEMQTEVKSSSAAYDMAIEDKLSHSSNHPLPFTLYREDEEDD
jgi:hypothetical protein